MKSVSENKSTKNPFKRGGMFEGASHFVFELAKDLRRNMTDAEKVLWLHLKNGVKRLKFRRQHPGIYIADFYYHKVKLIVEADGLFHDRMEIKEYDKKREGDLKAIGYCILRFTNEEIFTDLKNVLEKIETKVEHLFQSLIINQKQKVPQLRGWGFYLWIVANS